MLGVREPDVYGNQTLETINALLTEEAQRLGRVLRPKSDGRRAQFYTLVSLRTCEEELAQHRQLFLTEQGYRYHIQFWDGHAAG